MNIASIVNIIYDLVYYTLLARILLSWFPINKNNGFVIFIYTITEPILAPFRNLIPMNRTGIDFSPLIVFFLLNLIRMLIPY